MNRVWHNENLDVLLVLAMIVENTNSEPTSNTISQLVEKSFSALADDELSALKTRAESLDELPKENRKNWREICLEKLIRQKHNSRLDENINPVQIGKVLSHEPKSIQKIILRNLPKDLSQKMAQYLELKFDSEDENIKQINPEISELVKREFISNFVSFEDIYEPLDIDRLNVTQFNKFVHHLGLREVAIACRGIVSKETLASFLSFFSADDAREIVLYLTELEKIKPFWVMQADELVREKLETETNPNKIVSKIGFKLLAIAFVTRDETARKYTQQKFSTNDLIFWNRILKTTEKEFYSDENTKIIMEKRQKIVERLAVRFIQTDRL